MNIVSRPINLRFVALCALPLAAACSNTPQTAVGSEPSTQATAGSHAAGASAAGMAALATAGSTSAAAGARANDSAGSASSAGSSGSTSSAGGSAPAGSSAGGSGGATASPAAGGSGGAAGVSNAGGSGGTGGSSSDRPDLGKGDGSDVITIGDSWMSIPTNGGGIEGGLDRAGTKYRHYSAAGTTLINGDIPMQYDRAKAANPKIATVVMTGGGNDVMYSGGCNTKDSCTMFAQRIADALDQLWTKMVADGVTTTVYIQYSKNAGTAPADTRPDVAPVPKICTAGKLRCLSIDTTDLIAASDTIDGIHPTMPGCDRIAKRVLDNMAAQGARR
jgi:lysophospholipase L1-like esterase